MVRPFRQCESHPGRLLVEHLEDVAARARCTAIDDPWPETLGLFHDVGKATSYFADHLHGKAVDWPSLSHHAKLGAILLLLSLSAGDGVASAAPSLEMSLAYLAVRGHHTGLDDLLPSLDAPLPSEKNTLDRQLSTMDVLGLNEWLREKGLGIADISLIDNALWQRARLAVQRRLNEPATEEDAMHRLQRWTQRFGLLIEADRDSAAQAEPTSFAVASRLSSRRLASFRKERGFGSSGSQLSSLRDQLFHVVASGASTPPTSEGQLWTLTAPTGSGKTLAALAWALRRRELRSTEGRTVGPIIYALPFTSIIEQNSKIIRSIIGTAADDVMPGAFAEHHHLAEIGATGGESSPIARLWAEGWRADVVCTTFVQVAQALFHATPADARRFARLCNGTLILDEVQAVRAEFWPLLRSSLHSLSHNFGVDVALMTATQPAIFKGEDVVTELVPENLRSTAARTLDRYDMAFQTEADLTLSDLADRVASEAGAAVKSALVVLNTIQEAVDLFEALSNRAKFPELLDHRLLHLSTNLRPIDRRRILTKLMEVKDPCVLVSTQVVEAGVDLSFERVFRANAPIDSIVQAAGRCNRHADGARGKVVVLEIEGHTNRRVYGAVHMDVARRVSQKFVGQTLREPEVVAAIDTYFRMLSESISCRKSDSAMGAVRQLEFGALRGAGKPEKAVFLITDQGDHVPHFVETDDEDAAVWSQLINTIAATDNRARRRDLRALRPRLAARIVDVPKLLAARDPDPCTGIVHIPQREAARYYDRTTGWIRSGRAQEFGRTEIVV